DNLRDVNSCHLQVLFLVSVKPCKVCTINGGCGLKSRLCAMGINSYSEIEVLKSEGHGPVIVGINETRLALGQIMASKIIVETA
ncbi:MAG: FeoA domain-containing protein, partial [Candidatus Thermoplasmatota archaeon]|nr:FeoA domain-containing protein [Candidatus Thermoplasmatota archaeon]